MYIENQVFIKKQRLNYCIYYIKWQCVTLWISSPEWDAKDKCLHVHVCWRLFFANSITLELDCFHRLPLYCVVKNISTEGKTKYESKHKIKHFVLVSLQIMNHFLLGNEMCGLVDQRHKWVEFVWPVVEQVIGVFGPLKVDDASQPVNLGVDGLVYN